MTQTAALVRGCGTRKKGGIYAEVPLSMYGQPLEHFLIDPPIVIETEALGLTSVGVKLMKRPNQEIYDVWDIVGQEHYPNVADFVEETRRFGISRRLPKTLDFSLLSTESKLILLHARAHIDNTEDYAEAIKTGGCKCPKNLTSHQAWGKQVKPPMCIGLWWHDIELTESADEDEGESEGEAEENGDEESVARVPGSLERSMPSFKYTAHGRPPRVIPEYKTAIFAAFTLDRIAVIEDPDAGTHTAAMTKAQAGKLPVVLDKE